MGIRQALAGGLPLPVAFWQWGIFYGLLLNGGTTLVALFSMTAGAPPWLSVVLYFLPLPYNISVAVMVWNSAGRWQGAPHWATLARITILAWVLLATAI